MIRPPVLAVLLMPLPLALSLSAVAACGTEPLGRLTQDAPGEPLEYISADANSVIKVDLHTITVTHLEHYTVQHWGDPHENLNGKHTKDWNGDRRTLLLQSGVKITMHAAGPQGVVETMTIYEGTARHQIRNTDNTILISCDDDPETETLEAAEADGETAHLAILALSSEGVNTLYYQNVYTEIAGENGVMERTFDPVPLGEAWAPVGNVGQVNDYYDDPRLGHT